MLVCDLNIFFGAVSLRVFGLFLKNWVIFLMLRLKNSLHILYHSPLTDVSFLNIFIPAYVLSFHSLGVFKGQKFLVFMKSNLLAFDG